MVPSPDDFRFDRGTTGTIFVYYVPRDYLILEVRLPKIGPAVVHNFITNKSAKMNRSHVARRATNGSVELTLNEKAQAVVLAEMDAALCDCGRDLGLICNACLEEVKVKAGGTYAEISQIGLHPDRA